MIWISHPTGNEFVRALIEGCNRAEVEMEFHTTLTCPLPARFHGMAELRRRSFPVPVARLRSRPVRELIRIAAGRVGVRWLTTHERGWASVDAVYQDLDSVVARRLRREYARKELRAVYAYEDGALATFNAAHGCGVQCQYELPIAYWETSRRLLEEEARRLPEWEETLVGTRDSEAKLERKTQEVALANTIICPSKFVFDSLPAEARRTKQCVIAPFGSPEVPCSSRSRNYPVADSNEQSTKRALRVLFAGSMTQRKGLADVFAAMKLLARSDLELVVMGSVVAPMEFYREQYQDFTYEPTRPHAQVIELMRSCDVLVLPSIVEGRALVQQEAMSCGLPIIVTANAGGEDLIEEGVTGFLVPIRSPERIADKIAWFADHRAELEQMREPVKEKAQAYTWEQYGEIILDAIRAHNYEAASAPQTALR